MNGLGTVFLVDDDGAFRTAASQLLNAAGLDVQAFESAEAFLARGVKDAPGCLLTELQMPGLSGLELQTALAKAGVHLPVVFLCGHGDIPTCVQAMRSGAEDFLAKGAPKEKVFEAVNRALARDARERSERTKRASLRALLATLTVREHEVLEYVVQGKMNKQIAHALGLHERTVKLHRTAITTKLGRHSTAELTQLWLETR
jgi:FixJ family two-component response regulator